MSTYTHTEPALDPAREIALGLAIDFHKDADSDDPATVVATAEEFLVFLQGRTRTNIGQSMVAPSPTSF